MLPALPFWKNLRKSAESADNFCPRRLDCSTEEQKPADTPHKAERPPGTNGKPNSVGRPCHPAKPVVMIIYLAAPDEPATAPRDKRGVRR